MRCGEHAGAAGLLPAVCAGQQQTWQWGMLQGRASGSRTERECLSLTAANLDDLVLLLPLLPLQASAASGKGVLPLFASLFSTVLGQLPQMGYALVQCAGQEAAAACQAEGLAQLRLS